MLLTLLLLPCLAGLLAFRLPSEIDHHLDKVFQIGLAVQRIPDVRRHDSQEQLEIVSDFLAGHLLT